MHMRLHMARVYLASVDIVVESKHLVLQKSTGAPSSKVLQAILFWAMQQTALLLLVFAVIPSCIATQQVAVRVQVQQLFRRRSFRYS